MKCYFVPEEKKFQDFVLKADRLLRIRGLALQEKQEL